MLLTTMVPRLSLTPNSNRVWASNLSSGRPASYPGLILDKILDKKIRGDRWDWLHQTQVWRKQGQMRTDWLLTPVFRSGTSAAYLPAEGANSQEMEVKHTLSVRAHLQDCTHFGVFCPGSSAHKSAHCCAVTAYITVVTTVTSIRSNNIKHSHINISEQQ